MVEDFLLMYVPQSGRVAVDVGANVGDWSLALAQRFGHVYAVEPNPALTAHLGSLAPNITAIARGVWDTAGPRTFTLYESDKNTSALGFRGGLPENVECGTVEWECGRLDDLIPEPVSFMKIDVEAAEAKALAGAQAILDRDKPHLLVEVHGVENGEAVAEMLNARRYKVRIIRNHFSVDSDLWRINYWIQGIPL